MKNMMKIFALVLAMMMLCTAMASAEDLLDIIKAKGTVVMATEATYPPYDFLDDNGNPDGVDVWLGKMIAEKIGVTLEVKDTGFDGIIPAISNGEYDIGIGAFTVTPARAEVIDFSHCYEVSEQMLVVKKGNADVYTTKESMAGKKVGAQMGTIQSQLITKALPDSELFELDVYPSLALEVVGGGIIGFVVDAAVGNDMIASNDQLECANFHFSSEEASFGKACVIRKDNDSYTTSAFQAVVNEVIDTVVADGSYAEIFAKYTSK